MKPTPVPKPAGEKGDPGEDMNVRHVHAAIWREFAEPREIWRRTPWYLRHFYFILFLWVLFYLINFTGSWKWSEYEDSSIRRSQREDAHARLETPPRPQP